MSIVQPVLAVGRADFFRRHLWTMVSTLNPLRPPLFIPSNAFILSPQSALSSYKESAQQHYRKIGYLRNTATGSQELMFDTTGPEYFV